MEFSDPPTMEVHAIEVDNRSYIVVAYGDMLLHALDNQNPIYLRVNLVKLRGPNNTGTEDAISTVEQISKHTREQRRRQSLREQF